MYHLAYPSTDRPWLKYYSQQAINTPLPECTIYEYLWENNHKHLQGTALLYFDQKFIYGSHLKKWNEPPRHFWALE